jgi:hypothetical protein
MQQFVTPDENHGCEHLFVYREHRCSQTPNVLTALDQLSDAIKDDPAKTIIEVGTLFGAFTRILQDHDISAAAAIHTFDVVVTMPKVVGVTHHLGNVFGHQLATVRSLIEAPGRCLVFCDGGDKEREVNTFSDFLKPGDIIMCHDYARDPKLAGSEAYGKWPSYESSYANMEVALARNNCVPFMEIQMQRAAWGCFIRG